MGFHILITSLLNSSSLFKVIQVIALSSIKFFVAPFLALKHDFNFMQIFLTVTIGGLIGVVFFFYLSEWLVQVIDRYGKQVRFFFLKYILGRKGDLEPKKSRVFTRKNRFIVKVIKKYGMVGLIILTPVVFTIPLGTFLIIRYFSHKENVLLYLSYSVIIWALILTVFVSFF